MSSYVRVKLVSAVFDASISTATVCAVIVAASVVVSWKCDSDLSV